MSAHLLPNMFCSCKQKQLLVSYVKHRTDGTSKLNKQTTYAFEDACTQKKVSCKGSMNTVSLLENFLLKQNAEIW